VAKQLEAYYSGNAAWRQNVKLALQNWRGTNQEKALLERLHGDQELAAVVAEKVGEGCLQWLDERVPALGGRKPISCLGSDNLILRLREALMRMD
jgi:hypothetical protein